MSIGGGHGGGGDGFFNPEDVDDDKPKLKRGKDGIKRWDNLKYEFDCPECNANNPWGDGFKEGDEVNCHYCGCEFKVQVNDSGKIKLKLV